MYLSSPRVNIAEESVEDHRVQLQCKFYEMEGKYTEAKPRCTCPSYESNLHQVGEVQHQLPLNLMLVHFRPHLCSGYTDQYHPPDAPLVVVEVDDGVDAARAGQQGEADHDGDLPGVGVNRTLRPRLNLNRC